MDPVQLFRNSYATLEIQRTFLCFTFVSFGIKQLNSIMLAAPANFSLMSTAMKNPLLNTYDLVSQKHSILIGGRYSSANRSENESQLALQV